MRENRHCQSFGALIDQRDKDRAKGSKVCCSFDRVAAAMLAKGKTTAFALALACEPRIDRQLAFKSGLADWLDIQRFKPSKGPKPAQAFCLDLAKLRDSCRGAGFTHEEFDRTVGFALALRCCSSTDSAYFDAKESGGLAKIDLSFLNPASVLLGVTEASSPIAPSRGPYEIELLLRSGIAPSSLRPELQSLSPSALRILDLASEKEKAFSLRDALDLELPQAATIPAHSKKTRAL